MVTNAKKKAHYINNKDFSHAVVDYVSLANKAKEENKPIPKVTDYIATCFIKIAEGLSHRPNFVRYTYRDEMVMDGVENCLRAINNYKIETATRTKEKKQQDIKMRFIEKMGIEDFTAMGMDDTGAQETMAYVDTLKERISKIRHVDKKIKTFGQQEKKKAKEKEKLELFMSS
jgi:hypothetical protein